MINSVDDGIIGVQNAGYQVLAENVQREMHEYRFTVHGRDATRVNQNHEQRKKTPKGKSAQNKSHLPTLQKITERNVTNAVQAEVVQEVVATHTEV